MDYCVLLFPTVSIQINRHTTNMHGHEIRLSIVTYITYHNRILKLNKPQYVRFQSHIINSKNKVKCDKVIKWSFYLESSAEENIAGLAAIFLKREMLCRKPLKCSNIGY